MNLVKTAELNKNLPEPLYSQLKEAIKRRIKLQEWAAGSKIPSESEICEMYDISRITARKAMDELQREGYLEKQQGKGTFVRDNAIEQKLSKFYSFSEELKRRGLRESALVVSFLEITANEEIASALHLSSNENVYRITRVRTVDQIPYAFEQSYIPCRFARGLTLEQISEKGLYRSLADLGVNVDSAVEKFRAINLDLKTAKYLRAAENEAAISLIRTAYSGTNRLEYCKSVVIGDFFSYTVDLK